MTLMKIAVTQIDMNATHTYHCGPGLSLQDNVSDPTEICAALTLQIDHFKIVIPLSRAMNAVVRILSQFQRADCSIHTSER